MLNGLTRLSDKDFQKLSVLIYSNYGIKMPETKKIMLEGRLRKRLKANNIDSFEEYCEFLFSKEGIRKELIQMIDVVSTNKTDFFREPAHFDFLQSELLPSFLGMPLKIWTSACSTGEEAYSIAISVEECRDLGRIPDYSIYCTDISTQVLDKALLGVYDESRVSNIPINIRRKYFQKNKNKDAQLIRVNPELRNRMTFNRLNLMDISYNVPMGFDVIFCRNVLIYFDKQTQEKVVSNLCRHLKTGGFFFLGHSESISGFDLPLKTIKPTIFQKLE